MNLIITILNFQTLGCDCVYMLSKWLPGFQVSVYLAYESQLGFHNISQVLILSQTKLSSS